MSKIINTEPHDYNMDSEDVYYKQINLMFRIFKALNNGYTVGVFVVSNPNPDWQTFQIDEEVYVDAQYDLRYDPTKEKDFPKYKQSPGTDIRDEWDDANEKMDKLVQNVKYKTVYTSRSDKIDGLVQEQIKDGYLPQGGVAISHKDGDIRFLQAMVK